MGRRLELGLAAWAIGQPAVHWRASGSRESANKGVEGVPGGSGNTGESTLTGTEQARGTGRGGRSEVGFPAGLQRMPALGRGAGT